MRAGKVVVRAARVRVHGFVVAVENFYGFVVGVSSRLCRSVVGRQWGVSARRLRVASEQRYLTDGLLRKHLGAILAEHDFLCDGRAVPVGVGRGHDGVR